MATALDSPARNLRSVVCFGAVAAFVAIAAIAAGVAGTAGAAVAAPLRWDAFGPGWGATKVVEVATGALLAEAAGRLYRSVDEGGSWAPVAPLPGTLLGAVPGSSVLFCGGEGGLFRSGDGGRTWTRVFDRLVHSATFGARVSYLSDYSNLHRSTDGGRTWQLALPSATYASGAVIDPRDDERVAYAARGELVWKTADGGTTWKPVLDAHGAGGLRLAISPSTPGTLYAVDGGGLYRSDNGGATWSRRPPLLPERLVVDPGNPSRIYALLGGGGLRVSTDGGKLWQLLASLPALESGPSLDVTGTVTLSLWLSDGRLFRSVDSGATWERPLARGLPMPFRALRFAPGRPATVYLAGVGVFRSDDSGQSWTELSSALGTLHVEDLETGPAAGRVLALSDQRLLTSGDGGHSWRILAARGGLDLAVVGAKTLVLAGQGIATSIDSGRTWTETLSALVYDDGSDRAGRTVDRLLQQPRAEGTMVALTTVIPNRGAAWHELQRSSDRGAHWRRIALGATGSFAAGVCADGTVYLARALAGTDGAQLLRSGDGGHHWQDVHHFDTAIADLACDPTAGRKLYAATPGGVQASDDGGAHWHGLTLAGLVRSGAVDVRRVLVSPEGRVYAAGAHGGIFTLIEPGS